MNKFFIAVAVIITVLTCSCGQDRPPVNARGESREEVERQALDSHKIYIHAVGDTARELANGLDSAEAISIASTTEHSDLFMKNTKLAAEFITWDLSDPVRRQWYSDEISRDTLQEARDFAIAVVVRERSKK